MFDLFLQGSFWLSVAQIIAIDILLGGDNAVVIALACRRLPEDQRRRGILWGVAGAIALRIVLIFFALQLLALPYLKIAGALLLLLIGVKLLQSDDEEHANIQGSAHLLDAIKTIIIADAVMSLDNVIAVAGAAKGGIGLVAFGITISIPIIVWGSQLVLKLMDRFPIIITLGGALLGWIAGDMLFSDVALKPVLTDLPGWAHQASALGGAIFVVLVGAIVARRALRAAPLREISASESTTGGTRHSSRGQ